MAGVSRFFIGVGLWSATRSAFYRRKRIERSLSGVGEMEITAVLEETTNDREEIAREANAEVSALIAFGSNLGDPEANVTRALELLAERRGVTILKTSSFYRTFPVGGPAGQPIFLNGATLVRTTLSPFELLKELHHIEQELRRVRYEFWGPRTIDLDIVVYGNERVETPELTIPHPRVQWRDFVLQPACEIAPEMVVPGLNASFHDLRDVLLLNFRLFPLTTSLLNKGTSAFTEAFRGGASED